MSVDAVKPHPPETLRQAKRWDVVKRRYVDAGLCDRCAAQIGWGHQDNGGGWNDLRPPCGRCTPVVRGFSVPTTNPLWRKFERPQDHLRNRVAPVTPGEAVEDIDALHSDQEAVLL
jgi:hypothetical protein